MMELRDVAPNLYRDVERILVKSYLRKRVQLAIRDKSGHDWIDGPDGEKYHCQECGISKVQDYGSYHNCEAWIMESAARRI